MSTENNDPGDFFPHDQGLVVFGDEEAENHLLAAMMDGQFKVTSEVLDELAESDLVSPEHRDIYRAIKKLTDNGEVSDVYSVIRSVESDPSAVLKDDTRLFVMTLSEAPYVVGARKRYLTSIKEAALRRELLAASREVSRMVSDPTVEPQELLQLSEDKIYALRDEGANRRSELREAGPLVTDVVDNLMQGEVPGIPTGLVDLDKKLGRMRDGNLIVIGARPSMGKTALGLTIATNVVKTGGSVAFFSIEQSADEIGVRMLSAEGKVDGSKLNHRRDELTAEEWTRIADAASTIQGWKFTIDDSSTRAVGSIRSNAQQIKAKGGLSLVVIDYVQLMAGDDSDNRVQEISNISRALKVMAGELGVPVILLSQLNRSVEHRQDKRPTMSDLRESGAIEQDADVVLLIYRDDYYDEASPNSGIAELIISKNRSGARGMVEVTFDGKFARFGDFAPGTI